MSVVYADPRGHSLRMVGGLGPLQALGVSGSMTWMLRGTPGQTTIIFEYAVGGYMAGGLDKVAPMVDQVQDEQAQRLAKAVTTGDATKSDLKQDAKAIISARASNS